MTRKRNSPNIGPSASSEHFIILDGFLGDDARRNVWESFVSQTFNFIHDNGFERVFRLYDGNALYGEQTIVKRRDTHRSNDESGRSVKTSGKNQNPETKLINSIIRNGSVSRFLSKVTEWRSITVQSFIYPVGAGLGWHDDDAKLANFIYYPHPHWDASWGGELLISGAPVGKAGSTKVPGLYRHNDARVLEHGVGTFVMPKPDRLVMIRGGVSHCIKKVDAAAGSAIRASYSGFVYG